MHEPGFCRCGCGLRTRLVAGAPRQFVYGHQNKRGPDYREEDRGHRTPCWIWQRKLVAGGYGQISQGRRRRKAHVVFYERVHGPVPAGLQLDHVCRQRDCVNPDHVEPVTGAENVRRSPRCKLTLAKAREIRASTSSSAVEALRHGVSEGLVRQIRTGRKWKEA